MCVSELCGAKVRVYIACVCMYPPPSPQTEYILSGKCEAISDAYL